MRRPRGWHAAAAVAVVALLLSEGGVLGGGPGGGGDSLRGALEALDRRQRALQQHPALQGPAGRYRYPALRPRELGEDGEEEEDIEFLPLGEPGQPEDIGYGFQRGLAGTRPHETRISPAELERLILEYLEDDDDGEESEGRWGSPFREREAEEEEEELDEEKRARSPVSMFRERQRQEKRASAGDDRYLQLLAALWEKYQRELDQQRAADDESVEKRQDDYGYGYDFYNTPMGWGDSHFNGYKRSGGGAENDPWYPAFELVPREHAAVKRFPVRKRSSGPPHEHEHRKRSGGKVAADLASIFEEKKKQNESASNSTESPSTSSSTTTSGSSSSSGASPQAVHPGAMHKKAVDWSQYFGIDKRRKKSSPETAGSEPSEAEAKEEAAQREMEQRAMEQYYRTLALATSVKRKRSGPPSSEVASSGSLESMDHKLKAMEDLIVDEAVKFTGAHQGTADPKEIQNVKEQVLSRLAAAYSLEKMRQALDEFRASMDREESPEKRQPHGAVCPELGLLAAACVRSQPAFAEPCTWHHACQQCAHTETEAAGCDAGFLRAAEHECEGRASCLRGARRLLAAVAHATVNVPCEPCVRRFLEETRRR